MFLRSLGGLFLVLHGFVHLWYVVLSQGWVEIEEQMGWGGHSWLLSSVLSSETILTLASVLYIAISLGFVIGGVGVAFRQGWWESVIIGAALLSTLVIVVMWDGEFDLLIEKGAAGILINIGLFVYLFAFN